MRRTQIAVIGNASGDEALLSEARLLGTSLVDLGYRIVCGGRGGVMQAVAEGAHGSDRATGGDVVGILPTLDAKDANPHVDIVIPTGMNLARNTLVVASADAVVAIGGGSGTLSEMALAWQLGKPIVALIHRGGWAKELAGRTLDARRTDAIREARSVDEAIAFLQGWFPADTKR